MWWQGVASIVCKDTNSITCNGYWHWNSVQNGSKSGQLNIGVTDSIKSIIGMEFQRCGICICGKVANKCVL